MNAYPEIYLNRAMTSFGEMFDFAINDLGLEASIFINSFVSSSICRRIQNGEASCLVGQSGVELALACLNENSSNVPTLIDDGGVALGRTADYWIGWAVCFYQWSSGRSFSEIFNAISWEELLQMYTTLHEGDVRKFAELADKKLCEANSDTRLRIIRLTFGCSQNELSKLSGVSLRSIQMYEQRHKDINKAQAETLFSLAKALGCHMEDLIEPKIPVYL